MFQSDNRFSLLIVDDDLLLRELLYTIFAEDNYLIHTAENGVKALSLLEKTDVDAAIVDLQMKPGTMGEMKRDTASPLRDGELSSP